MDAAAKTRIGQAMERFQGIGLLISHDRILINASCPRSLVFHTRHTQTGNMLTLTQFKDSLAQIEEQEKTEDRHAQEELNGNRRELDRLNRFKAARFQKLQHVDAVRRQGRRIDSHDHDARNTQNWPGPGPRERQPPAATDRLMRASPQPADGTPTCRLPQNAMTEA